MKIDLEPGIADLLRARVAAGQYATVEEAVTAAVLGIDDDAWPADKLDWTKPYLEEARRSFATGNVVENDEVWRRIKDRFGPPDKP